MKKNTVAIITTMLLSISFCHAQLVLPAYKYDENKLKDSTDQQGHNLENMFGDEMIIPIVRFSGIGSLSSAADSILKNKGVKILMEFNGFKHWPYYFSFNTGTKIDTTFDPNSIVYPDVNNVGFVTGISRRFIQQKRKSDKKPILFRFISHGEKGKSLAYMMPFLEYSWQNRKVNKNISAVDSIKQYKLFKFNVSTWHLGFKCIYSYHYKGQVAGFMIAPSFTLMDVTDNTIPDYREIFSDALKKNFNDSIEKLPTYYFGAAVQVSVNINKLNFGFSYQYLDSPEKAVIDGVSGSQFILNASIAITTDTFDN